MYTYQDFKKEGNVIDGVKKAIQNHMTSEAYMIAKSADLYNHQKNETIMNYVRTIFTLSGTPMEDFTASNNRLCSNFFHRLNTQRNTYLLGNGTTFNNDSTKDKLGYNFDINLKKAGFNALIHGVSFGFWNVDKLHVFPLTEFAPLWDEEDGTLKAGVRFWQIDDLKPITAILYEEDGYTKYRSTGDRASISFEEVEPKKAYKITIQKTEVDDEEVVSEDNYSSLPVVPLWGSNLHQSTLVGMREKIDSFDLIRSGFANDLSDCSQIYWILENCNGMSDAELARFRDRLKIQHIATADTDNSKVTPYTQDIPYAARKEYLDEIRSGIYEDFGGLDVHTVAAGATNDHIDAAYQPMDEEADDYEYQVTEFVRQILALNGIDDAPTFKRNRISNEKEQVEMIMMEANYLDDETILKKLPNITIDEVESILQKRDEETAERFEQQQTEVIE